MIQDGEIAAYLHVLVQYMGAFFGALFVICLYAAYEFNRRLHIIPKNTHPITRKLFHQLRFLLLFMSLHFAANTVYVAAEIPSDLLCLLLAITHLVSYIGVGITGMSIALSPILTIGRVRDNQDE